MGNVRRHGRGWQLIYQVVGQRHWETVRAKNRTEATNLLKVREGQAAEGRLSPVSARRLRYDDLASDLVKDYELRGNRSAETLAARLTNLKGYFSGRLAGSITTADVEAYTERRLADGASSSTVRAELGKLRRMFNLALRSERLYRKPYIPLPRESKPRQGFFEPAQFAAVLANLPDYLAPLAEFAYYTGWRRSEITSLLWDQIDLPASIVRLWTLTTKNTDGRVLPLEGELWRIVRNNRCNALTTRLGYSIAGVSPF